MNPALLFALFLAASAAAECLGDVQCGPDLDAAQQGPRLLQRNTKKYANLIGSEEGLQLKHKNEGDIEVACKDFTMVEEDQHPGGDDETDGFAYGECTDVEDDRLLYTLLDTEILELIPPLSKAHLTMHRVGVPDNAPVEVNERVFYNVTDFTLEAELLDASLDSSVTPKQMSVLMIRLNYEDQSVTYSEDQIVEYMYGTDAGSFGTLNDMIEKASYGKVSMPKEKRKIVSVNMGKNWASVSGCPYNSFVTEGLQKVRVQHPEVKIESYHFREFFIPYVSHTGGCGWGGLANVGCGYYSYIGTSRTCNAWYRSAVPFVRAHEIGHNFGLLHAGGPSGSSYVEYGDPAASMGASYRFSSFIASARYQAGWLEIGDGKVIEWTEARASPIVIHSISLPLGQANSDGVAIRIACPTCTPKVSSHSRNVGGHLWVQFRGDEGYSSHKLSSTLQNRVYVHLARKYTSSYYGKGSEMWSVLSAGEYFNHAQTWIFVCSIEGDLAKISIGASLESAKLCGVCPLGYKAISQDLDGDGQLWASPNPDPQRTLENCASICNTRDGCTSLEFAEGPIDHGACGTYTGGASNIGSESNRLAHNSNWRSCVKTTTTTTTTAAPCNSFGNAAQCQARQDCSWNDGKCQARFMSFRFEPVSLRSSWTNAVQIAEIEFRSGDAIKRPMKVTNPNGVNPQNEEPDKAIDGKTETKWLDFKKGPLILEWSFPGPGPLDAYRFTTANDETSRDPCKWKMYGSSGGDAGWVLLHSQITTPCVTPTGRFANTAWFDLKGPTLSPTPAPAKPTLLPTPTPAKPTLLPTPTPATPSPTESVCKDMKRTCEAMAAKGSCAKKSFRRNCPNSCGDCNRGPTPAPPACTDDLGEKKCSRAKTAKPARCEKKKFWQQCRKTCGKCEA